jgi:hypothetical protein
LSNLSRERFLPPPTANKSSCEHYLRITIKISKFESCLLSKRNAADAPLVHINYAMNISQPVSSAIGRVEFGILSPAEIKNLSVKKIQNPTTFDTLLHPVPEGLYDPALGAWGDAL